MKPKKKIVNDVIAQSEKAKFTPIRLLEWELSLLQLAAFQHALSPQFFCWSSPGGACYKTSVSSGKLDTITVIYKSSMKHIFDILVDHLPDETDCLSVVFNSAGCHNFRSILTAAGKDAGRSLGILPGLRPREWLAHCISHNKMKSAAFGATVPHKRLATSASIGPLG